MNVSLADAVLRSIADNPGQTLDDHVARASTWREAASYVTQAFPVTKALLRARLDRTTTVDQQIRSALKLLISKDLVSYDPSTGACTATPAGSAHLRTVRL